MADAKYSHLTTEAIREELRNIFDVLASRASGEDLKTEKYNAFISENGQARTRIIQALYKLRRPATALELSRSLRMPIRTVYYTTRQLTEAGWITLIYDVPQRWEF